MTSLLFTGQPETKNAMLSSQQGHLLVYTRRRPIHTIDWQHRILFFFFMVSVILIKILKVDACVNCICTSTKWPQRLISYR